jgi:hypothetical protein
MPELACMTDIETLSTLPNAAIITIGAVMFDPRGEDTEESLRPQAQLFGPISFESNEKEGRHISASTIAWWLKQSPEAQAGLFEGNVVPLRAALESFRQWVNNAKPAPTRFWAKDPDFDGVILQDAFRDLGLMWPFRFWESRSVRTTMELAYPPGGLRGEFPQIGVGVAHNAVDDSIRQALSIQHAYKILDA